MVLTSDCFHLMIHLFIIEERFFIVFMLNVLFDHILFYTFKSKTIIEGSDNATQPQKPHWESV